MNQEVAVRLRIVAGVVAAIVLATPARASEPGQPLDCSDWVFLEPGLTCTTLIPYPCDLDPTFRSLERANA